MFLKPIVGLTMFKKALRIFMILVLGFGIYATNEYRETKKLVNIVITHELNASFYIRQFRRIDDAKDLGQLKKAGEQTLLNFQQAGQEFERLTLLSPRANDVRQEYLIGIKSLQHNINQIDTNHNNHEIKQLKKDIKKSEQILLNAREKLFNLSTPYMLTARLKMD